MVFMKKLVFILLLIILYSCSGGQKHSNEIIDKNIKKIKSPECYIVFPAKLLYEHSSFDIFKQTSIFEQNILNNSLIPVVSFVNIETDSINNFFNQSNLYLYLKNNNILYKNTLIIQPVIKVVSDSTQTQTVVEDDGISVKKESKTDYYLLEINVFSSELEKNVITLKDKFQISPFDIDYEKDDSTYFLTERLNKLSLKLINLLNNYFSTTYENLNKYFIYNPYISNKTIIAQKTIFKHQTNIEEQSLEVDSMFLLLIPDLNNQSKKILYENISSVYVKENYKKFKKGDVILQKYDSFFKFINEKPLKIIRNGVEVESN